MRAIANAAAFLPPRTARPVVRLRAVLAAVIAAITAARGGLFGFVPVFLALGIGVYFSLAQEPGAVFWGALAICAAVLAGLWWRGPEAGQPLALALLLMALGAGLGGARAQFVSAPVLGWHYYGAIQGRIVAIDRSGSDALRLTLDHVALERLTPQRTPKRIRISLHGDQGFITPEAGMVIILTGHLSPPSGPAEPGGFDFRRLAWFAGLGAVGYTRTPVLLLHPPEGGGLGQEITRLRLHISARVQGAIPGEAGAFAAAILTGDRSGIGQDTLEALRASNLAHLLAISGLHMGLLTGLVFVSVRVGLALIPPLALRLPTKKIAAVVALLAAAFYLALSGGNVATERAFIMVAVMLGAVLADRRALSLRSVALAALIILVARPESLLEAGFQMSFAATTALVAVFSALAKVEQARRIPKWANAVLSVVLCSFVAGLATAPIAAAQFNRLAEYGLLANVLSVPLMGSVVMPAAILAGVLSPIGLGWIGLRIMELGTLWILGVAHWVAGLEGAVIPVATPPDWALPAMILGGLWLILWPGWARLAGAVAMGVALIGWEQGTRPALFVAQTGTLAGVMTPDGRALSKASGERFVAEQWLQGDGDVAEVDDAALRSGFIGPAGSRRFDVDGVPGVHLTGRGAVDRLAQACASGWIVILGAEVPAGFVFAGGVGGLSGATAKGLPAGASAGDIADGRIPVAQGGCWLLEAGALAKSGSVAVNIGANGVPVARTAVELAGRRPWTK